MLDIEFYIVKSADIEIIQLISEWYKTEWNMPAEKALLKLKSIVSDPSQLHVIMKIDGTPIATGGLHHHTGLLDREPRFAIHKNWLALVYTLPEWRHQGHGAALCNFIQDQARINGVGEMHLFTDTAEPLYRRLGWKTIEQVSYGTRNVVVMSKEL